MHSLEESEILKKARHWLEQELPFVVFRHPQDHLLKGVFQNDQKLKLLEDYNDSGFVFAPFDLNDPVLLTTGEYLQESFSSKETEQNGKKIALTEVGKERHVERVGRAVEEIDNGEIKKVVLSRLLECDTTKSPDAVMVSLLKKYNSAFCYWWYHPKVDMWLGATPERFLSAKDDHLTMTSLAGTLPFIAGEPPNWTNKEKEEQQMVTDYIETSLSKVLPRLMVSKVNSSRAGKLWHLKSEIQGELPSFNSLGKIIRLLHPTPAVCGIPKRASFEYILKNEGYNREFYTGFLGPLNLASEKSTDLFVNLRCLKYANDKMKIYVGGGITASSIPEKEWEETQLKSRTILEVL